MRIVSSQQRVEFRGAEYVRIHGPNGVRWVADPDGAYRYLPRSEASTLEREFSDKVGKQVLSDAEKTISAPVPAGA